MMEALRNSQALLAGVAVAVIVSCVTQVPAGEGATVQDVSLAPDGTLLGVVKTPDGHPQPDTQVELHNAAGLVASARTDARGLFLIPDLRAGEFRVQVDGDWQQCLLFEAAAAPGHATALLVVTRGQTAADAQSRFSEAILSRDYDVALTQHNATIVEQFTPADQSALIDLFDEPSPMTELGSQHYEAAERIGPMEADVEGAERRFDPALVARGQAAFNRSCLDCHDAERALAKSKSYGAWLATVRRMASKDGADISVSDQDPIATYLASRSAGPEGLTDMAQDAVGGPADGALSLSATISTLWRFPEAEHTLESPGFFADAWLTASWQPDGPLSATVTTCTSCHSDSGFTFELVEGSATLDLLRVYCDQRRNNGGHGLDGWEAKVKAGRFVVPFGAFAAMSHPGVYRTLTNPLIYDMGRDFLAITGGVAPVTPVIMMPYSDEGIQFSARIPIWKDIGATMDVYAVNGLQPPPFMLRPSRSYRDNNTEPAAGGRVTVGSSVLRLGASAMYGDAAVANYYTLGGVDATARIGNILRLYAEYAFREHDSVFVAGDADYFDGYVAEAELYLCHDPGVSVIVRYDTLDVNYAGGFTSGEVERFTSGINLGLPGGSLLLLHHEHWNPDPGVDEMDLIGARWTCTF